MQQTALRKTKQWCELTNSGFTVVLQSDFTSDVGSHQHGTVDVQRQTYHVRDEIQLCILSIQTLRTNNKYTTPQPFSLVQTSDVNKARTVKPGLGGVMVRTLDLRSRGHEFDSRSGRYQVVATRMGECLRTGKPSRNINNTKDNSALHPSRLGKSHRLTVLILTPARQVGTCLAGVKVRSVNLCRVASNTVIPYCT